MEFGLVAGAEQFDLCEGVWPTDERYFPICQGYSGPFVSQFEIQVWTRKGHC